MTSSTLDPESFGRASTLSAGKVSTFSSTPVLDTNIDSDILQGIYLTKVMQRYGQAFGSKYGAHEDFDESFQVDAYDDFISHDWGSGRWHKFIALCIIYNSPVAIIASVSFGGVLCVMQHKRMLAILPIDWPYAAGFVQDYPWLIHCGIWSQLLCPFFFTFILLFWQQIRRALCLPIRIVFLDKYCIDQKDPEKKAAGILGLAGFLRHTERLVICWTPRYFTRLWCTYEIASWLHIGKPFNSVLFFPLATGLVIVALGFFLQLLVLGWHFAGPLSNYWFWSGVLLSAVLVPWAAHTFRHLIHNLRILPQQIQNFSITNTGCLCCSVNHEMPDTGEPLACDRKMVYKTVKAWFPDPSSSVGVPPVGDSRNWPSLGSCSSTFSGNTTGATTASMLGLQAFDAQVRNLFGNFILQSVGPTRFNYSHILVGAMPYMYRSMDILVAFGTVKSKICVIEFATQVIRTFALIPSVVKLWFHLLVVLDKLIGIPESRKVNYLTSVLISLVMNVVAIGMWYLLSHSATLAIDGEGFIGGLPFCAVCIVQGALTMALYRDNYQAHLRPQNGLNKFSDRSGQLSEDGEKSGFLATMQLTKSDSATKCQKASTYPRLPSQRSRSTKCHACGRPFEQMDCEGSSPSSLGAKQICAFPTGDSGGDALEEFARSSKANRSALAKSPSGGSFGYHSKSCSFADEFSGDPEKLANKTGEVLLNLGHSWSAVSRMLAAAELHVGEDLKEYKVVTDNEFGRVVRGTNRHPINWGGDDPNSIALQGTCPFVTTVLTSPKTSHGGISLLKAIEDGRVSLANPGAQPGSPDFGTVSM